MHRRFGTDVYCLCTFGDSAAFDRGFMHGHNPNGPGMLDMYPNGYSTANVPDGTTNTLFVGEITGLDSRGDGCGLAGHGQLGWMSTWAVATTVFGINTQGVGGKWHDGCVSFRSHHPGGSHFVLVDGSVHFLSETIDPRTFGYLGARNDGEIVQDLFRSPRPEGRVASLRSVEATLNRHPACPDGE